LIIPAFARKRTDQLDTFFNFLIPLYDPGSLGQPQAFGAVPVAAGVIGYFRTFGEFIFL